MEPLLLLALGIMNMMGQMHNYGIDVEKNPHLKDIRVRRQIDSEPYPIKNKEYEKVSTTTVETPVEPSLLLSKLKGDRIVRQKRYDYMPTDSRYTTSYNQAYSGYNQENNGNKPIFKTNNGFYQGNNGFYQGNNGFNQGNNGYDSRYINSYAKNVFKNSMPGFEKDFIDSVVNDDDIEINNEQHLRRNFKTRFNNDKPMSGMNGNTDVYSIHTEDVSNYGDKNLRGVTYTNNNIQIIRPERSRSVVTKHYPGMNMTIISDVPAHDRFDPTQTTNENDDTIRNFWNDKRTSPPPSNFNPYGVNIKSTTPRNSYGFNMITDNSHIRNVPDDKPRYIPTQTDDNEYRGTNRNIWNYQSTSSSPNYFRPYGVNTISTTPRNSYVASENILNSYKRNNGRNNGYYNNYVTSTEAPYPVHNSETNFMNPVNNKIGQRNYYNNARVSQNNGYDSGTANSRQHSVVMDAPVRSIEVGEYHHLNRKRRSYEDDAYKLVKQQQAAASAQIEAVNKQHHTNYYNPYSRYSNGNTVSSTESIRYSTANYNQYSGNNNNIYSGSNNGYSGMNGGYQGNVNNNIGNGINNGYNANKWNNFNTTNNGFVNTYSPFKNNNLNNTVNRYQYNVNLNNETKTFINNNVELVNGTNTKNNVTDTVTSTTPKILQSIVITGSFGCPKFMQFITIMGKKICMPKDSDESSEENW